MHCRAKLTGQLKKMRFQQFLKSSNVRFQTDVLGNRVPCSGTRVQESTLSKLTCAAVIVITQLIDYTIS